MSERREIPYWMAHPRSTEAPDSALHDILAVGLAIAVLLVIFLLASVIPGPVPA